MRFSGSVRAQATVKDGRWLGGFNDFQPYDSLGNGAGMRVSPAGLIGADLDQTIFLAEAVTKVTHSHPEGIRGGVSIAAAMFLLRTGSSKEQVREYVRQNFYDLDFTIDSVRPSYSFTEYSQTTNPIAFNCFFESAGFADAIRLGVSVGGDTDTICAMVGALAEAHYGIPPYYKRTAVKYLDDFQSGVINNFYNFLNR